MLLPRAVNPQTGEQRLAVPGILQGTYDAAKDAFTLPGDVMAGKTDPMSDEGIARAAGFASLAAMPATSGVRQKAAASLLPREVADAGRQIVMAGKAPKTVQAAHQAASKGYKQVWGSDAVVGQDALNLLRHDLRQVATDEGLILPSGTMVDDFPRVRGAMKAMEEFTAEPLTMKSARIFHRQLRRAAKSTDPEEAIIGSKMLDQFEEFMIGLPREAFAKGDGVALGETLKRAKGDWHTYKKGQVIDDAITAAYRKANRFSGSGLENALRRQFEQLASNPKKMRYFNAEERRFIEAVSNGTPIANALQYVGKFAPTGVVGTVLSALAGFNVGGMLGSAATLGAGTLGRMGATRETKKAAKAALGQVLGNGKVSGPARRVPQPLPEGLVPLLQVPARQVPLQLTDDDRKLNRGRDRRRARTRLEA